jgi:REP element-mobilizing transposase RayT
MLRKMEKFSNVYVSDYHRKYYLKVHLIFVCKYRKKLLNDIVSGHLKNKNKKNGNNN